MQKYQMIIKPIVTEKGTKENKEGKYTFMVNQKATKIDIKKALKELYGMDISEVNIIHVNKKIRLLQKNKLYTKRAPYKKAVITTRGKKQIDMNKFTTSK